MTTHLFTPRLSYDSGNRLKMQISPRTTPKPARVALQGARREL
jgi:hypothetical protein